MEGELIETRTARIWLGEDGIIRSIVLRNAEQVLADVKENIAALVEVSQGKKRPLLVDIRIMKSVDREAREYLAGDEATRNNCATAMIVGSPLSRTIGNFIMIFNKPRFPTKLFTSEAAALAWLKEFVE